MKASCRAYMMIEALVYIGVLFALLGVGYAALYRCIEHSVALRRNAHDIAAALHAGERWRADVRAADGKVRLERMGTDQLLRLPQGGTEVVYRFAEQSVFRRVGTGSWSRMLTNVVASGMEADARQNVTAWRWELELEKRVRTSHLRPFFSFLSVPEHKIPE